MACTHEKEKVMARITEYWDKTKNEHKTWVSGWRCECGEDVEPETYKSIIPKELCETCLMEKEDQHDCRGWSFGPNRTLTK